MLTLVTAGTGTAAPHPTRVSAGHWLERGETRLLMDCGAGALHRLAEFGCGWPQLTHLALTHFHLDHVGEVPALIFALKYATLPARSAPLTVLGPRGTRDLLARLAAAHGDFLTDPGFPLTVRELAAHTPFDLGAGLAIEACPVPHTPESVAFGVTGPEGRVVYTGDTGPSDSLADWARGCDLLLAECSLPDSIALPIHLTPRQAGALADRAKARKLVLTHFYPPVEQVPILDEVAEHYEGRAVLAEDGSSFHLEA